MMTLDDILRFEKYLEKLRKRKDYETDRCKDYTEEKKNDKEQPPQDTGLQSTHTFALLVK
jgi:hypothetical protein